MTISQQPVSREYAIISLAKSSYTDSLEDDIRQFRLRIQESHEQDLRIFQDGFKRIKDKLSELDGRPEIGQDPTSTGSTHAFNDGDLMQIDDSNGDTTSRVGLPPSIQIQNSEIRTCSTIRKEIENGVGTDCYGYKVYENAEFTEGEKSYTIQLHPHQEAGDIVPPTQLERERPQALGHWVFPDHFNNLYGGTRRKKVGSEEDQPIDQFQDVYLRTKGTKLGFERLVRIVEIIKIPEPNSKTMILTAHWLSYHNVDEIVGRKVRLDGLPKHQYPTKDLDDTLRDWCQFRGVRRLHFLSTYYQLFPIEAVYTLVPGEPLRSDVLIDVQQKKILKVEKRIPWLGLDPLKGWPLNVPEDMTRIHKAIQDPFGKKGCKYGCGDKSPIHRTAYAPRDNSS